MSRTLDYISQELVKAIQSIQPDIKNEYNRIVLSNKQNTIIIPKQINSLRSSNKSRSV